MTPESHDQNFKNLLLDFPQEALTWLFPQAIERWGPIRQIEFVRQEPKKRKLRDPHLALDMPILFSFAAQQVLLWLVEFQEDKRKFSIYTVLRYATDLMEAYPRATVIPTVIFTERAHWRKDVARELHAAFGERVFLHFEYLFVRLFDFNARDFFDYPNPLVKILLPKMNYAPAERWEVIWQAYKGLFALASLALFEKYVDFIDIYAAVREEERAAIYHELYEHEETVMIAQMLRNEGRQEGRQEGKTLLLSRLLSKKFHLPPETPPALLAHLESEDLFELGEYMLDCESFEDLQQWIQQRLKPPLASASGN